MALEEGRAAGTHSSSSRLWPRCLSWGEHSTAAVGFRGSSETGEPADARILLAGSDCDDDLCGCGALRSALQNQPLLNRSHTHLIFLLGGDILIQQLSRLFE